MCTLPPKILTKYLVCHGHGNQMTNPKFRQVGHASQRWLIERNGTVRAFNTTVTWRWTDYSRKNILYFQPCSYTTHPSTMHVLRMRLNFFFFFDRNLGLSPPELFKLTFLSRHMELYCYKLSIHTGKFNSRWSIASARNMDYRLRAWLNGFS